MLKKAFITGSNGQDGSYLIEFLIEKGYEVHGIIRRSSTFNTERIDHLMNDTSIYNKRLFIHHGDVTDPSNINQLLFQIQPDEIYNLAAQSHVKVSFEIPYYTGQVDALGTLNLLEAARTMCPKARLYQASTSELYGGMSYNMPVGGYTEDSHFHPRSPYGCAKIYGYWIVKNYRESYNMYACNGILFNHESPRRGGTFVTKKITDWFAKITNEISSSNISTVLELGNLNAYRDWGHARDYIEAMWLMLQQDTPEDYVISTGEAHSVKEFIDECFKLKGLSDQVEWVGQGLDEKLIWKPTQTALIVVNPKYFRPAEVEYLLGNSTKAQTKLNWKPKYNFNRLVAEMIK